jgi:hypothetical protein
MDQRLAFYGSEGIMIGNVSFSSSTGRILPPVAQYGAAKANKDQPTVFEVMLLITTFVRGVIFHTDNNNFCSVFSLLQIRFSFFWSRYRLS